jgi:hypothetical protein
MKNNMDGSGDAASLGVVDAVPWGVRWIANHDATKRFFAEFPTLIVGHFGEDGSPEDAKLGGVSRRRRKESERDATGEADITVVSTVAHVQNCDDNARPHGIWDGHTVDHRRCIIPDFAPRAFGLAEHVMGIGGRKLHTDVHASTHLAGYNNLKTKVRVKLKCRGEGA